MSEWSLPFAERYHAIRRRMGDARARVERLRADLDLALDGRADAEDAWAWMWEYEADQVAALEAHHAAVRQALQQAGWFGGKGDGAK